MVLLDTAPIVDYLRGDPRASEVVQMLEGSPQPIGTTPFTYLELFRGVGKAQESSEERRAVESLLGSLHVFEFTPEAAQQAGLLDNRLRLEGDPVPLVDLLIGAIALHYGQPVLTADKKDYERIPGLEVFGYDSIA